MKKLSEKYFKKILTAKIYDLVKETPLDHMSILSARINNNVYVKREDLQPVFSFKIRGAYNKMAHLNQAQLKKGVVAASAGNHAQGVALAARHLGSTATIVMPESTPQIKIDAVKALGAKVILKGAVLDQSVEHAKSLVAKNGYTFVHPYDDPEVIAGQGTIGMEVLRQMTDSIDVIFVCIGGGGLISGIASYVKFLSPKTKVIGVEPADAASMQTSLKKRKRVLLEHVGGFADGAAVRIPGKECFTICQNLVDEVITVSTDEICAAIKDFFEDTRTMLEPAGALATAGLVKYSKRHKLKNKNLVTIASGANMNFHRLRHVSERAEIGEGREAIMAVTIPERPGSFKQLIHVLGKRHITEFNYRRNDPTSAHVYMGVQVANDDERVSLIKKLKTHGYKVLDLSQNEVAKLHLRHMVGGTYAGDQKEIVYRFEFPERLGALSTFLHKLPPTWNISLFHYRNHGTDYGRVLVGLEVSSKDQKKLAKFLKDLGYHYHEETKNPVCRMFL